MEEAFHRLRLNRAGVNMHLQDEHFKTWLKEEYPAKESTTPPKPEKWMKLVDMVQFMCEHRTIPEESGWMILILVLKGNTDNQEIGLLEVL